MAGGKKEQVSEVPHKEVDVRTEQYLEAKSPEDYCLRKLLKMLYYLSEVRKIEVLQIQADFIKDQNDQIWFYHAKNIIWRPRQQSVFENKVLQRVEEERKERQEILRADLVRKRAETELRCLELNRHNNV